MKNQSPRRLLAGLLACVLLLALLAGCDGGNHSIIHDPKEDPTERIDLTFFGFKTEAINQTAIDDAIQSFMGVHKNVNITYEGLKNPPYWEVFQKRDAVGELDDVVMMHHDYLFSLVNEGKLADLRDLPGLENYSDSARTQFTFSDGSVYFLPTSVSTYNLYINYDLLEAHGQSIPTNWNEFQAVCDYFVFQGITPIVANNRNSLPTMAIARSLTDLYQQPQAELERTLEQFNQDPSKLAEALYPGLQLVAEMQSRHWIDPEETLATAQTSDDLAIFAQGDRPFMLSGGWASMRVRALEPDFTYGVHPYPILEDGSVLPIQVDTCISVNAQSEHLEEAMAFAAHLIEPDVMYAYCDTQASYSPLKDSRPLSDETLAPSIPYQTDGPVVFRSDYRMLLPMESTLTVASTVLLNGGTMMQARAALVEGLCEQDPLLLRERGR